MSNRPNEQLPPSGLSPEALREHCLRNLARAVLDVELARNPDLPIEIGVRENGRFRCLAARSAEPFRCETTKATPDAT